MSSERITGPEQMISSVIRVMGLRRERWSDELFEKEREEGHTAPNISTMSRLSRQQTVDIMCCFSSCHIKIPMRLF